jgi:excisionase family DNA binding protein
MRVEDAAALLGISRGLAYELVNRGELPALRLGRRIVVPTSALEELVASAGKAVPGAATSTNGKGEQVDDNKSRSSRRRRTATTTIREEAGRLPLDGLGSRRD